MAARAQNGSLNMEADGAENPEGKGERVCREDKKS